MTYTYLYKYHYDPSDAKIELEDVVFDVGLFEGRATFFTPVTMNSIGILGRNTGYTDTGTLLGTDITRWFVPK